jgi:hypothetical protein
MVDENQFPKKESISDAVKKFKEIKEGSDQVPFNPMVTPNVPVFNQEQFEKTMSKETDPDLMMSYEVVQLPSKGLFYENRLSEVNIEYMTSKDEDLLTTPSLIENGTVVDILLKRKIKTPGVNPENLLPGDRSALILFLRSSSYGPDYKVTVTDPRDGKTFPDTIDLTKLKYKEVTELPDEHGYFTVELPMRKRIIKFKLLTSGEDNIIFKKAKSIQEAYGEEFNQYSTMKLKTHIVSIDDKTDRSYIDKFVDVMPALDAYTIRKKIQEVSPEIDMKYRFKAKDGYEFEATLSIGVDFFFPNT